MKFAEIKPFICYGKYEINIPLSYLKEKIEKFKQQYNLEMNPDFQRGHVWNIQQRISWVEYFFKGGVTGRVIYFNCSWFLDNEKSGYDNMVIVDGLQRLTSFLMFLDNEIPIFNGHYYKDFEDKLRVADACDNLKFNINDLKTKKEVLEWYLQMNTGGTIHSQEEIKKVKNLLKKEENLLTNTE